ncbi:hypothetical protein O0L34_g4647 [Tuta absoluta]|nr:hypothetical protein O0L34_g4647 [Tuta absoluta]
MPNIKFIISLVLISVACGEYTMPHERDLIFTLDHQHHVEASRTGDEVYRLPETVVPLEYEIYLDLYFDERTEKPYSFDGRVIITVQAVEANLTQIVLHSNVDSVNSVSLTKNGVPHLLNVSSPITLEPQYHFLKINLAEVLETGVNYTLTIEYENIMNEGPMKRGIWRGWYKDANGTERIYATTHFQPYNARQAFPCWDEPGFKAVFKLHLSKPTAYWGRFHNTGIRTTEFLDNGRIMDSFHATPKMSSYLLSFLVSETFTVIAEDDSFDPPIRIIGRSNTVGMGDHALKLAVEMTKFYDEYFGIPFSSMHTHLSNDHISSPDWASAGTENWGLVSYRELYMIIDPREALMSVENYAATLISHELAHKWFGNLITCYWWSNTWINEGYASYFGYYGAHAKFPKYELVDHFNGRYVHTTLSYDSGTNAVALNHAVNTPQQVTGHFGTVSYSKGAAFLRQTISIISEPTFRKSCNYFLVANAFEPTDQYDLLLAFQQAIQEDNSLANYPSFNFEEYFHIWINIPGSPLLNVDVDHATGVITLSQERFFISANAPSSSQIYPIPITFTTQTEKDFNNVVPRTIMTSQTTEIQKIAGQEWVLFNIKQHGIYRVNYDDKTWDLLADALLTEPESIHYLNRAQIVDDVFALIRSGRMSYGKGFRILRFLRNEVNFYVWDAAISGYNWIRSRMKHIPSTQAEFDRYLLSYMETAIVYYGFDTLAAETPTQTQARQIIMHFACTLGHKECIKQSRSRFLAFKHNQLYWINTGIRRNVYTVGVREGDEDDFNFLQNYGATTNYASDLLEIFRALGATKNSALLKRYLDLTLTHYVRFHDKATAFSYALLGNQENAVAVLDWVKSNIDAMRVAYVEDAPPNPVHTCLSNLASYLNEEGLQDYEQWLQTTQSSTAQYNTAISAITSARNNMAWGTQNAEVILGAAKGSATRTMTSLTMLLLLVIFAINV